MPMLVVLQLVGAAGVPVKVTVLEPCDVPKFVPVMVTGVPGGPEVGLRPLMVGPAPAPPPADLNAAMAAPQLSEEAKDAVAETGPASAWSPSSTITFAFGSAGAVASIENPLPAVKVAGFAVRMVPKTRSPFAVVAALPLLGAALTPSAAAELSSEFAVAIPEYSKIAKRKVPVEMVSDTVIVFAPPAIFSA